MSITTDWAYVDTYGNIVEPKDAEILLCLTLGEYYHLCGFRLKRWNLETIKRLMLLGDHATMEKIIAEIEAGVLTPKHSLKARLATLDDVHTVKAWESRLRQTP